MSKGLVSIVGSGPGDPELITIKGINRLRQAEIIFHDKLSPDRIIKDYSSDESIIKDVGKRKGKEGPTQNEINQQLLKASKQYQKIVRLKGGDPFLFGRGGEETEYLAQHNIKFEIIPGVSSLTAVPASAGIPLTHRSHSSSVGIITGHFNRHENSKSHNWASLVELETIVVFMGITRTQHIAQKLINHGLNPETPASLIGWGATPKQESLTATVEELSKGLENPSPYLPGIIIIGDVVSCRTKLKWFENKNLFGERIMVTRPEGQASRLGNPLKEQGARIHYCPAIEISELREGIDKLNRILSSEETFDWIVFTSRNGVDIFFKILRRSQNDYRKLGAVKFACIGPGTKEKLQEYGFEADLVPPNYRAEELCETLLDQLSPGSELLLPRARGAREVLPEKLRDQNHNVQEIQIYESTQGPQKTSEKIDSLLTHEEIDLITFMSSSTVENFFNMIEESPDSELLSGVDLAAIGPITNKTLKKKYKTADIIPEKYDLNHFLEAITEYYQNN